MYDEKFSQIIFWKGTETLKYIVSSAERTKHRTEDKFPVWNLA